jgi:glycerol-3-phosphate O-acyltransferase / dihydroxyacetone phosphate acyltransferase
MIYRILKFLFRITVRAYFRKYEIKNSAKIPTEGPLIIVANHPSAFMDPIVLAVAMKREIHFIAKGEAFRSKFAAWLLPKFNMIPIYRKEHDPQLVHRNEEVFRSVYKILEKNGVILIFPEGISLTDRKLKQIKTGASRMAIGAEMKNDFNLGVKIIPVGLNYSNPHKFQSDLFININDPILLSDFKEMTAKDSFVAAHQLTDAIRQSLEEQIVAIDDESVDQMMHNIETIYKSQVLRELGYSSRISEHDYIVTKMISERVHYYLENDPVRVEKTKVMIDDYFRLLNNLDLDDRLVRSSQRKTPFWLRSLGMFFYLLIGFPLFLFGTINNYLPWRIPNRIAHSLTNRPEFIGAITMVAGLFTFLVFYALQIWVSYYFFHDWGITLSYALLLPVSGFFAYFYWKRFTHLRRKWMFLSLFIRKTELVSQLILKREQIIEELEKGRKDYDAIMLTANN